MSTPNQLFASGLCRAWAEHELGSAVPTVAIAPFRVELGGHHSDFWSSIVIGASLQDGTIAAFVPRNDGQFVIVTHDAPALKVETQYRGPFPTAPITQGGLKWVNRVFSVINVFSAHTGIPMRGGGTFLLMITNGRAELVGAGVSSSASMENALLLALDRYYKTGLSRWQIACLAKQSENDPFWVNVGCGFLDQMSSAFGEPDSCVVTDCAKIAVDPTAVRVAPMHLQGYTPIVAHCGIAHALDSGFYDAAQKDGRDALEIINRLVSEPYRHVWQIDQAVLRSHAHRLTRAQFLRVSHAISTRWIANQVPELLQQGRLRDYGLLMAEQYRNLTWHGVTCEAMDRLIAACRNRFPEIVSCCMQGGGGGGTALIFAENEAVDRVVDGLKEISPLVLPVSLGGTCEVLSNEA